MRKLLSIFTILMFIFVIGASGDQNELDETYEIQRLISKQIMYKIMDFIKTKDFTKKYDEEYYKPIRDEMAEIIENFNKDYIVKNENKITSAFIAMMSRGPELEKVKFIYIRLTFMKKLKKDWKIIIPIKGKGEVTA